MEKPVPKMDWYLFPYSHPVKVQMKRPVQMQSRLKEKRGHGIRKRTLVWRKLLVQSTVYIDLELVVPLNQDFH